MRCRSAKSEKYTPIRLLFTRCERHPYRDPALYFIHVIGLVQYLFDRIIIKKIKVILEQEKDRQVIIIISKEILLYIL